MRLLDLLKTFDEEALSNFAERCDSTPKYLLKIARGHGRVGTALAINIERESGGRVRCEDLRPDVDWEYLRTSRKRKRRAA